MPTLRLLVPLVAACAAALAVSAFAILSADPELATGEEGGGPMLVDVVGGLEIPTHVTVAPGQPGLLYVAEQPGRIRVVVDGQLRSRPFLDISDEIASGGEQGLLSVAFHPAYAENGLFYVDYTDVNGDTRVVEYRAEGGAVPMRTREILAVAQPYPNHNGGQLAFGPDGRLYVGMGDGGKRDDPDDRAQDLGSLLGKLLAIDVDASSPEPELVAYGLRNPWRFSFDRETGDLWIADVGQDAWEEVDLLPFGSALPVNFGWDVLEGLEPHEDTPLDPSGPLLDPIAVYGHGEGCSITGGFVYRGREPSELTGRYLYGDYCSGAIWSVAPGAPGQEADVRREPLTVPGLTTFGEDAAGRLYLASANGAVYRLRP